MTSYIILLLWDRVLLAFTIILVFLVQYFMDSTWYYTPKSVPISTYNNKWPFIGFGDLSHTDGVDLDELHVGMTIYCRTLSENPNITRSIQSQESQDRRQLKQISLRNSYDKPAQASSNLLTSFTFSTDKITDEDDSTRYDEFTDSRCYYIMEDYSVVKFVPEPIDTQCSLTSYCLLLLIIAAIIQLYRNLAGFYFTNLNVNLVMQLHWMKETSAFHSYLTILPLLLGLVLWLYNISLIDNSERDLGMKAFTGTFVLFYALLIFQLVILVCVGLTPKIHNADYFDIFLRRTRWGRRNRQRQRTLQNRSVRRD